MSNFNHCPIVWHFCDQSSVNKMEKIQERAFRFICDDFESPLQDLLQKNGISPLHVSRMKLMAREVFKIVNNLVPSYSQALISLKPSTYDFRQEKQAQLPHVNSTRYGLRSFQYEAAGSGTASRMSLDWLNLTLSSGGCFRLGTGSTVSVPLVLPDIPLVCF